MTKNISVIGLGKLGLSYAACLASRGFNVVGVDINTKVINMVSQCKAPIFEPGLEDLLKKHKHALQFTTSHEIAINETDASFILVATPSDSYGRFSNIYIEKALQTLAEALAKSKKSKHLFVIGSTLMPGSIQSNIVPLIEKYSKRRLNEGFEIAFVPDFVALGSVIHDFLNPDLVLIGESNMEAGITVEKILKKLVLNNPPIEHMSFTEAEIAKVALNCFITMKISFANSLANLCEKVPGTDVDNITRALGFDKRISPFYLKGGPSFGGTCFPRDVKAYIALTKKFNVQSDLIQATHRVNNYQKSHLLNIILKHLPKSSPTVAILGTAFKQNTPIIEESISSYLIPKLIKRKVKVTVYDNLAGEYTKKIFGNKINYATSIKTCLWSSSTIVISNPDKNFKALKPNDFKAKSTVIDCWRNVTSPSILKKINYIPLGVNKE